jgi:hypothetical protein
MQHNGWLAARIAARLPVHTVAVTHRQQAMVVRFDWWIQRPHPLTTGFRYPTLNGLGGYRVLSRTQYVTSQDSAYGMLLQSCSAIHVASWARECTSSLL